MCKDVPGEKPRKRIAICTCGGNFPDCDLEDAKNHITKLSSPSHKWVWIDPEYDWRVK